MKASPILAIGLIVLAHPAAGQRRTRSDTGTRMGTPAPARVTPRAGLSEADRSRLALNDFARCTLDRSRARAEEVLSMPIEGAWVQATAKLADSDCLAGGQLRFQPQLLRGAMFAELWRRRMIDGDRGAYRPVLTPVDTKQAAATGDGYAKQLAALLAFAQCVVDQDRDAPSDIVVAPTGSERQNAAYAKVRPLLGPCLPQGSTIELSKSVLEGAFAEVLYRLPATQARSGRD